MCKAVQIDGSPCRMVARTRDGYCALCAAMTIHHRPEVIAVVRRSSGILGEAEPTDVAPEHAAA